MKRCGRSFFTRSASAVARDMLGAYLVRKKGQRMRRGMIVEVEVYPGPHDRASHAYGRKRTRRNAAEYLTGGHVYIYLVYGMYWQLNISTGAEGYPSCVLIRALAPYDKKSTIKETNGPGKLCRWLKIDASLYAEDITASAAVWIEKRDSARRRTIVKTPRIGIDYAGREWALKPMRFYLKEYERFFAKPRSKFLI